MTSTVFLYIGYFKDCLYVVVVVVVVVVFPLLYPVHAFALHWWNTSKRMYGELLLKTLQIAGHAVMISVSRFLTIPTILLDDVYQYC